MLDGKKVSSQSYMIAPVVVDETKDALTLANTVSQDQSNCRIHIPKKWIQKRKDIELEDKQQKRQRKKSTTMGQRLNNRQVQPYE